MKGIHKIWFKNTNANKFIWLSKLSKFVAVVKPICEYGTSTKEARKDIIGKNWNGIKWTN